MSTFIDSNEWVPVHTLPGFEACIEYYVNRYGQVKSSKGKVERILKHKDHNTGYPSVNLTQRIGKGKVICVLVHKLVAFAFLGPPPTPYGKGAGCSLIHHKDENKSNPCADNLEWTTRSANNNAQAYPRFYGHARPDLNAEERREDSRQGNLQYMRRRREDPEFKEAEKRRQRERRASMTDEQKQAQLERNRIADRERRAKDKLDPDKIAKQRKYKREWARKKRAE